MKHRVEFIFFQLFKWAVLALPLKSAQRLGSFIGWLAYILLSSRRHIALDNLQHAFPEKSEAERRAIALGSFRNYGITLMELLWLPNLDDTQLRKLITPANLEVIEQGYSRGKGMVMLSGHFGNWELIAFGMAYLSGHPFTIIVQTQSNRLVDEVINRHRCLLGNTVIPMGMSVREIIKTLQNCGIVAIAPDQSGPMEGVFIEFFGRRVATHQGPAAFALRSGAPMQIGFIIRRSDGTYEVILEDIRTADLHGNTEANILELTRRHTAILERYIRRYPDHWLWMHRRWKHTWESVQREKQSLQSVSV
ncbi:MAG: lysophospholipid acyltransferase family protein [Ignavibacteriales bacterium]|nr:lysophospholipid acyltransferase family protein [Ignavibacteriales bacterium]